MRIRDFVSSLFVLAAGLGVGCAGAADYVGPAHQSRLAHRLKASIGDCVRTRVNVIGASADATPVIRYADGVVQAYDGGLLGHEETKVGDPIKLCLVSFTRDCDEDELPGRTYATGNLRTGAAWTLPDVRSSCTRR